MGSDDKGNNTMQTVLGHSSGEYISSSCVMPIAKLQGGGGSNPAQIMGASITYMRRYQYAAIIGLAQDDTDGVPKKKDDKPTVNDMSWVNAVKEDPKNIEQITDAVYKTRIQLLIKEGY